MSLLLADIVAKLAGEAGWVFGINLADKLRWAYAGVRMVKLGAAAQDFRFRLLLPDRGRTPIPSP